MKKESKKDTMLEAAAKIADEKGFVNLTLKDLAHKMGIKPPSGCAAAEMLSVMETDRNHSEIAINNRS